MKRRRKKGHLQEPKYKFITTQTEFINVYNQRIFIQYIMAILRQKLKEYF